MISLYGISMNIVFFFPHGTVGYPVLVEFGFGLTSSMFVYIDSGGNQLIGREKNMPPERHSWFPALCSMNQLNSTIEMVQLKSAILTPPPIRQDDYDYPD